MSQNDLHLMAPMDAILVELLEPFWWSSTPDGYRYDRSTHGTLLPLSNASRLQPYVVERIQYPQSDVGQPISCLIRCVIITYLTRQHPFSRWISVDLHQVNVGSRAVTYLRYLSTRLLLRNQGIGYQSFLLPRTYPVELPRNARNRLPGLIS